MSTTAEIETWLATTWATRVPTDADPHGLTLIARGPRGCQAHPVIQDHAAAVLPGLLDAMDTLDRARQDHLIEQATIAAEILTAPQPTLASLEILAAAAAAGGGAVMAPMPPDPYARLRKAAWHWIDFHAGVHEIDDAAEALDYTRVRAIARDRHRLDAVRQWAWSTILRCDDADFDRLAAPTPELLACLCESEDPTLRQAAMDDPRCPPAARLAAALT